MRSAGASSSSATTTWTPGALVVYERANSKRTALGLVDKLDGKKNGLVVDQVVQTRRGWRADVPVWVHAWHATLPSAPRTHARKCSRTHAHAHAHTQTGRGTSVSPKQLVCSVPGGAAYTFADLEAFAAAAAAEAAAAAVAGPSHMEGLWELASGYWMCTHYQH